MTHQPMLTEYTARVLQEGGRIVHGTENGTVFMRLEDAAGETILARVFAVASFLLDSGAAVVESVQRATANREYERVIVAS